MLIEIYTGKATIYFAMTEFIKSIENFDLLRDVAESIGNRSLEGLALANAAHSYIWAHDFEKAELLTKEALDIANERNDDGIKAVSLYVLFFLYAIKGKVFAGEKEASKVIKLSKTAGQPVFESLSYMWKNLILSWRGHYAESHKYGQKAIEMAEKNRFAFPLVHSRWGAALGLAGHGRYYEAITMLKDTIALSVRMSEKVSQSRQWNTLGWIYNELCDWNWAEEYNHKGLDLALPTGDSELILNAQINLADTAFGSGKQEQAYKMLEALYASLPQQHEWMKWRYTQRLTHSFGEVLLNKGDLEKSLQMAEECLDLAESTESNKNKIKGYRLRGQIFIAQEEYEKAERKIKKALEIAKQIGNPPQLWKTYVALGDLRLAQKKKNVALKAYHDAISVIENVAGSLDDETLKKTFLKSLHVRSIYKKAGK
jgi:tetratricopeptide (TPR) repeat protein